MTDGGSQLLNSAAHTRGNYRSQKRVTHSISGTVGSALAALTSCSSGRCP